MSFSHDASSRPAPAPYTPPTDPVPVGKYVCALTKIERKDIKDNKGWGFATEYTILSGPYAGRRAFPFMSYGHVDAKVAGWAIDDMDRLCHAADRLKINNEQLLLNIPVIAYWGQEKPTYEIDPATGKDVIGPDGQKVVKYPGKNTVKGFEKLAEDQKIAGAISQAQPVPAGTPPTWALPKTGTQG